MTDDYFSKFWRQGSVWWGPASWFIGGCLHACPHKAETRREHSELSFVRAWIPSQELPPWPHHLPEAPPQETITCRLRLNTWLSLGGGAVLLRAAALVCSLSYIDTHPLAFPQAHLAFSRRQPLANTQPGDWAAPRSILCWGHPCSLLNSGLRWWYLLRFLQAE